MLDGLKIGNEALKKANEMFSIEEIENIMEDTAEAIEKQKGYYLKIYIHYYKIIYCFLKNRN